MHISIPLHVSPFCISIEYISPRSYVRIAKILCVNRLVVWREVDAVTLGLRQRNEVRRGEGQCDEARRGERQLDCCRQHVFRFDKRHDLRGTGRELLPEFEDRLQKEAFCSNKVMVRGGGVRCWCGDGSVKRRNIKD